MEHPPVPILSRRYFSERDHGDIQQSSSGEGLQYILGNVEDGKTDLLHPREVERVESVAGLNLVESFCFEGAENNEKNCVDFFY